MGQVRVGFGCRCGGERRGVDEGDGEGDGAVFGARHRGREGRQVFAAEYVMAPLLARAVAVTERESEGDSHSVTRYEIYVIICVRNASRAISRLCRDCL